MMQNVFTKTLERITKETGLVGGVAIVFKNGEIIKKVPESALLDELLAEIEKL